MIIFQIYCHILTMKLGQYVWNSNSAPLYVVDKIVKTLYNYINIYLRD